MFIGCAEARKLVPSGGIEKHLRLTCFARTTLAVEAADAVDTRGAVEAGRTRTVVDVDRAVRPRPSVHADTREAADQVGTRSSVLADARLQRALVHIRLTMDTGERQRTLASVRVDAVDASAPVLAQIAQTVVDVRLAVRTLETCEHKENAE